MKVALLLTGRMELKGLPRALHHLFGAAHKFDVLVPNPRAPDEPFNGWTKGTPTERLERRGPSNLDKLVQRMAAAADSKLAEADLVFVLDDVELSHGPEIVVQEFRTAVLRHLRSLRALGLRERHLADRLERDLPDRASFHPVMPMIESWLFADPDGPKNAGAMHLPAIWNDRGDPEYFTTDDPIYLSDAGHACVRYMQLSEDQRNQRNTPLWLRRGTPAEPSPRERHPKHYLAWLCRDPDAPLCTTYKETGKAAEALAELDWNTVLGRDGCTFLRAFLADLADGLDHPLPGLSGGAVSPLTSHQVRRSAPVLRNL